MDAQRAETYLRILAETKLRHAVTAALQDREEAREPAGPAGPHETADDPADPPDLADVADPADLARWAEARAARGLRQVRYVAAVLTAAGALTADQAKAVTAELDLAIGLRFPTGRGLPPGGRPHSAPMRLAPPPAVETAPSGQAWPVSAVPVGQLALLPGGGPLTGLHVLTLVRAAGEAVFNVTAPVSAQSGQTRLWDRRLRQLAAVDDRGRVYAASFAWAMHQQVADGWLWLAPVPPPGVRWLELREPGGRPVLRADLSSPLAGTTACAEPTRPATPGERVLDAIAGDMLCHLPLAGQTQRDLDEAVAALAATGLLPPGSLVPGRLALLCQQSGLGTTAGPGLIAALARGELPAGDLPEPWTSVLAWSGRRHRPAGTRGAASIAAVLPELDGIRFILTGLTAHADQASLSVLALGLPEGSAFLDGYALNWATWFPWWLRDAAGQWHVASMIGSHSRNSELTTLKLWLTPPLSRPFGQLELVIPGRSAELRATIELEWTTHD